MKYDEEYAARELGKLLDGEQSDPLLDEGAFAADLMKLAGTIEPDARFAAELEKRLRMAGSTSNRLPMKQGVTRMAYPNRLRPLAAAAAALALVAVLTLTVPPLRSMAQDILNLLFNHADSDTQVYATPIVHTIDPTPMSAVSAPQTSLEAVEALAGFAVKTPAYLPQGFALADASYAGDHIVSLLYMRDGIGLTLIETPAEYAEALDVGASAVITPVEIGNASGQYVKGYWRADSTQSGSTVSVNGQTWDAELPFQQIRWQDGEMVYWLMDVVGQHSDLSLNEFVAIAESLD